MSVLLHISIQADMCSMEAEIHRMATARRQRMQLMMHAFRDGDTRSALTTNLPAQAALAASRTPDVVARGVPCSPDVPRSFKTHAQHIEGWDGSHVPQPPPGEPSSPTASGEGTSTSNSLHILPGDSVSQQRVMSSEVRCCANSGHTL
jgi:hypothetical protein